MSSLSDLLTRAREMTSLGQEPKRQHAFSFGSYWNMVDELADELETMREELELLRWFYAAEELGFRTVVTDRKRWLMAYQMNRAAVLALDAWRKRRD